LTSERDAFGPKLKAERDRRGITLHAISDSTKISISFLSALERNDMSRWPKGIFRRAFVREYAAALGLPPEPIVAEFTRLFPDSPCQEAVDETEFRLNLESGPRATWAVMQSRVLLAVAEVGVVLAVGSIAGWFAGMPLLSACGAVALVYYPLAGVFLDRSAHSPRLLLRVPPLVGWVVSASASLKQLSPVLPRPVLSMRDQETDAADGPGASPPEWRTAPN